MLSFAAAQGQGYLGWSWNTDTPPLLVTDFAGDPMKCPHCQYTPDHAR